MTPSNIKYSQHFESLVALVTHLAIAGGEYTDANSAPQLANRLGLDEQETENILSNFRGIFRKSESKHFTKNFGEQYQYTLQLRYARRKYEKGKVIDSGKPLTNEELFSLLEFITNKIKEEQENERQSRNNRITIIGVWVAAGFSLISAILNLITK